MNGNERIASVLSGQETDITPVAIDGMWSFLAERRQRAYVAAYAERIKREQRIRIDPDEDIQIRAESIIKSYDCFTESDDWIAVVGAPGVDVLKQTELTIENGLYYQRNFKNGARRPLLLNAYKSLNFDTQWEIESRYTLKDLRNNIEATLSAKHDQWLAARGNLAIVEIIGREVGEEKYVYTGEVAPFDRLYDLIGFEAMMIALIDHPDLVIRSMEVSLDMTLKYAQAFKDAGGRGIRIDDAFAHADLISQRMYERFALPFQERLFAQLHLIGLQTMLYFCGDVLPRLPSLSQLPIDALLVEDRKRTFQNDIGEVRAVTGPDLCLFGNIESYALVQNGTELELEDEIDRQFLAAGQNGNFVVSLGDPLPLDTPPENVDTVIRLGRRLKKERNRQ